MRVSAKADYAVRAAIELAAASRDSPVKADAIAEAQEIPIRFLENILAELRNHGVAQSRRGADGGYWLARDPAEITVGDVIRAVEGPLASVRGQPPEQVSYRGRAAALARVWAELQRSVRSVLDEVTIADVVAGRLPGAAGDDQAALSSTVSGWSGRSKMRARRGRT